MKDTRAYFCADDNALEERKKLIQEREGEIGDKSLKMWK